MPNVEFERIVAGEYVVRINEVREYEIDRYRTYNRKFTGFRWRWRVYQATVCIFDCDTLREAKRYVLNLVTGTTNKVNP